MGWRRKGEWREVGGGLEGGWREVGGGLEEVGVEGWGGVRGERELVEERESNNDEKSEQVVKKVGVCLFVCRQACMHERMSLCIRGH